MDLLGRGRGSLGTWRNSKGGGRIRTGIFIPIFTVIGIEGALGKTKATSSNLFLLRQFSARNVLCRSERQTPTP